MPCALHVYIVGLLLTYAKLWRKHRAVRTRKLRMKNENSSAHLRPSDSWHCHLGLLCHQLGSYIACPRVLIGLLDELG